MVDFRYYLNRQGPRGQQGVKGEQGYSPQVTVGKNTASEFTLKVINEDGSFETENLKVVPENRGGTYVRYDKDTYQEYIGDPDIATTRTFGVVRLATKEDIGTQEESRAVTSALLDTYLQENYLNKVHGDVVTGDVSFRGDTGFLNAPHIDKIKDENNNQYLTRNVSNYTTAIGGLVIPDDSSTRLTQGSKEIAYTSDLTEFVTNAVLNSAISNLVTLNTDQTITGKKTFTGLNTIQGDTYITKYLILDTKNSQTPAIAISDGASLTPILTPTNNGITLGNFLRTVTFAGDAKLSDGNFVLGQGSITAGDNITLERTEKGVKISSTGGGGASSINDSTISSTSTWSSSKINSEITTVVDTINSTKNDNIFDIGKFGVVGNPTITDDGIASGFSANNYLKWPTFDTTKPWNISFKFNCNKYNEIQGLIRLDVKNNVCVMVRPSGEIFFRNYYIGPNINLKSEPNLIQLNTDYICDIGWTGTMYYLKINNNLISSIDSTNVTSPGETCLGVGQKGYYSSTSSIDLKRFPITVDGKEVFNGLMESTKPIYDKITNTNTALSTFQTDTDNNFSAVNSALNEKANLSDLAGYVTVNKYNELLARVVALEAQIDGGIA